MTAVYLSENEPKSCPKVIPRKSFLLYGLIYRANKKIISMLADKTILNSSQSPGKNNEEQSCL